MGKNKKGNKGKNAQGKGKHQKSAFLAEQRNGDVNPYFRKVSKVKFGNSAGGNNFRTKVTHRKVA